MIDLGAVEVGALRSVEDVEVFRAVSFIRAADQIYPCNPVVRFFCPLAVFGVPGVSCKTGGKLEEEAVGNRTLLIVLATHTIHVKRLPSETSVAQRGVPATGKIIENFLGEIEPLRLARGRVGETSFDRAHGCETPPCLIVVTLATSSATESTSF